ncbi:MAG: von Willebrand factor type A domain-containing protein [Steroidobacteraceae bacterium]|nr:von Willebrand factor type A domain-containing protein [Steroidobacteraceae bacterium]
MKEFLDRNAQVLSPAERAAVWREISGARARETHPRTHRALIATAAGIGMAVATYSVMQREPVAVVPPRGVPVRPETAVRPVPAAAPEHASAGRVTARTKKDARQRPIESEVLVTQPLPVESGSVDKADHQIGGAAQVKMMESIEVRSEKRIDTRSSTTKQSISAEKLKDIPVDHLSRAVAAKAGIVAQGGELHFRGGRGAEVKYQFDGALVSPPASLQAQIAAPIPPVVLTTGGTRLPNDEAFDSMFFKNHGVNPFISTDEDRLSTFAIDVDAASYTLARRYLGLGQLPPADAVRVEEFVNFMPQGYPHFKDDDFRILIDGAPSPFGQGYQLLRIGIKARDIAADQRKPARLSFVIDVSGSMQREDRLELVKRALTLLVDELRAKDQVGIVIYGSTGQVLLEPIAIGSAKSGNAGRARILAAIAQLGPGGSTNAEEGLRLGYEMARRQLRAGSINRIVLCSDGVANVGTTGPDGILAQVRSEADKGIQLSTIGFGMGNYNDVLMERLADRGDGNYYYVDDIDEARRVFVENLTGTLQLVAKDTKVQVEFDSTRVLRYRLLGFENRDVADRDFRNDKVDAGEVGAGHEVTALYEVKLAPDVSRGRLATVRVRYAVPEHERGGTPEVREIAQGYDAASLATRFEAASSRFRLSAAVAEFAEILRGSYWAKESKLADVLAVARSAAVGRSDASSREFVQLLEKAAVLRAKAEAAASGK